MKNYTIRFLMAGVLLISLTPACKNKVQAAVSHADLNRSNFIYLNEERLEKVKDFIEKKDTFFTEAYNQLIVEADEELGKTQIDPGEDYH